MIPAALGNIVGGGVFVAAVYWYLYLVGNTTPIVIDGDAFNLHDNEGLVQTPVSANSVDVTGHEKMNVSGVEMV